jgi:hypothetical protein
MSREKTFAEKLREQQPISLPRSVRLAMEKGVNEVDVEHLHIPPQASKMLEQETLTELKTPYQNADVDNLRATLLGAQAQMRELYPQLVTLKKLQRDLQLCYLQSWWRARLADQMLAKLNGKLKKHPARQKGRQQDPEAAYVTKFQNASKAEQLRMLEELQREVDDEDNTGS